MEWWYAVSQKELDEAKNSLKFLEETIEKIEGIIIHNNLKDDVLEKERKKIKRLSMSMKCIKYYYSI